MSTKIYTAYQAKGNVDIWALLRDIRKKAEEQTKLALKGFYLEIAGAALPTNTVYVEYLESWKENANAESIARVIAAKTFCREKYLAQASSPRRNMFDFDVSLSVRELDGRFYIIPYADMMVRGVFSFLKADPRLRDFAYWNNTDKPDDVSERSWAERRRTWDRLLKQPRIRDVLRLEVCQAETFYQIDPGPDLLDAAKKGDLVIPAPTVRALDAVAEDSES